jgi:hypothetical protein
MTAAHSPDRLFALADEGPDRPDPRRNHPAAAAAVFAFDVDDTTYRHDRPNITGGEIMELAGITPAQGLVRRNDDGTTTAVPPEAVVYLVRGLQFRRRPRFKRG